MESLVMDKMHDSYFWKGKRVLVTGHTGFKGSWLTLWLHNLGASVMGVGLAPLTSPNLFEAANISELCEHHICNINDKYSLASLVRLFQPDIIFHLAAQALVRESYRNPVNTFETNIMGTVHLLEAVRGVSSVKSMVMVTTDKVYSNTSSIWPCRETDTLGGHDPYSASKAACELVINSYRDAFLAEQGVVLASARAGNVIGGGDWSADRLIPDAIRAWQGGGNLLIRSPEAIRPWQHVLEPISAYLTLAKHLYESSAFSGAYNFGPHSHELASVKDVIMEARNVFGKGEVTWCGSSDEPYEAEYLALETTKANIRLGVIPRWSLLDAIKQTMTWYKDWYHGYEARELCQQQIDLFEKGGR